MPSSEPFLEVLGGQVDVHHLVGLGQHRVGDALAHLDADQFLDRVVQALQVLDVQRGDDVNAGREDLLHVLVALGVAAAGHIRVSQLVDERDGRAARQNGVDVHLVDGDAVILDPSPRNDFQAFDQRRRVGAAVRLDKADDNIDALRLSRWPSGSIW